MIFAARQALPLAIWLALVASATAASEQVIHDFGFNGGSNVEENGAPAINAKGRIFGTALHGRAGGAGAGIVFMAAPPAAGQTAWKYKILYHFTGGMSGSQDGYSPFNGVTLGDNGVLYGATYFGGNGTAQGCGVVYQLSPPQKGQKGWVETILYRFQATDQTDGCAPYNGNLVLDSGGALYGTTSAGGGSANAGTVFRLNPPGGGSTSWTETVLYRFAGGQDGSSPAGHLVLSNGVLYGTSPSGGTYGKGYVWNYSIASGQRTVLYNFMGGTDGAVPQTGVVGPFPDSIHLRYNLVGVTAEGGNGAGCINGCGTAFQLSVSETGGPNNLFILHAFTGGADGSVPIGSLGLVGGSTIWGTTDIGGPGACTNGCGTLFRLNMSRLTWVYSQAYSFAGPTSDGEAPMSGVAGDTAGNVFGMTSLGGTVNYGTIFEYSP